MLLSCTQAHVCMLLFGVLSACNDAASPVLTDRFLACNISWDGALSSQRREASCWCANPMCWSALHVGGAQSLKGAFSTSQTPHSVVVCAV